MSRRAYLSFSAMAVLVLVAPVSSAAKLSPISGTVSKPGYTVLALAANGKATYVRARHGHFRLRPPANRVTLQLRAPSGIYAGPVVIGSERNGRRAIVGVRAGARLGKIAVKAPRGLREGFPTGLEELGRSNPLGESQEGCPNRRREIRPGALQASTCLATRRP